jgi:hypothetical protein
MDRAVVVAHESTVDRPHNLNRYAILFVHHKSHGPGRVQAGWRRTRQSAAARGGGFAGATLDHTVGHHFVRVWALRVAEANAHTSRGSRGWLVHPLRPALKGGGAGLAGVRAPVLRHVPEMRKDGDTMLTAQGWFEDDHERRRSGGNGEQRRWRLGRRSGRQGGSSGRRRGCEPVAR